MEHSRIDHVVSDYLTLTPTDKSGVKMVGRCPFCHKQETSLQVFPRRGFYRCIGCGEVGNVGHFLMKVDDISYERAIYRLAERLNRELPDRQAEAQAREEAEQRRREEDEKARKAGKRLKETKKAFEFKLLLEEVELPLVSDETPQQQARERQYQLNRFARDWFERQLWETEQGQAVGLTYLHEVRKLDDETIRKYHIGYAPDSWDQLSKDAQVAGFSGTDLIDLGLCILSSKQQLLDMYRDRVMFVSHNVAGWPVSYAGRQIKQLTETSRKYINSSESLIFRKTYELFGIYDAIPAAKEKGFIYLVEGQLDMISMHQVGVHNVVATGGTALTIEQINLLHRFVNRVVIMYDGDKAGIKATLRAIDMFLEANMDVQTLLLPDGNDPDSYSKLVSPAEFRSYLELNVNDFIAYIVQGQRFMANRDESLSSNVQKDKFVIDKVAETLSKIRRVSQRSVASRKAAERLNMNEMDFLYTVKRLVDAQKNRARERQSAEEMRRRMEMQDQAVLLQLGNQSAYDSHLFELPERNLIQLLVRYAEYPMSHLNSVGGTDASKDPNAAAETLPEEPEEAPLRVADYVIGTLEQDGLSFHNSRYQAVYELIKAHYNDEYFCAEKFFKYNADINVCATAIDLLEDQYAMSKIFFKQSISENKSRELEIPTDKDRLDTLTPRLTTELQIVYVKTWIEEVLHKLRIASHRDVYQTSQTTALPQSANSGQMYGSSEISNSQQGESLAELEQQLTNYNKLMVILNEKLERVIVS